MNLLGVWTVGLSPDFLLLRSALHSPQAIKTGTSHSTKKNPPRYDYFLFTSGWTNQSNALLGASGYPNGIDGQIGIQATCQNVETATPTPPLYPSAPVPAPSDAPFPISVGADNSFLLRVGQCRINCGDATFQAGLISAVGTSALQNAEEGANSLIECSSSSLCTEEIDTLALPTTRIISRRGLKFHDYSAQLMQIDIVSRSLSTLQQVATDIRAGSLNPYIRAFAVLNLISFDDDGKATRLTTKATDPTVVAAQAPWKNTCTVYGCAVPLFCSQEDGFFLPRASSCGTLGSSQTAPKNQKKKDLPFWRLRFQLRNADY